jgi:hypothetical protein
MSMESKSLPLSSEAPRAAPAAPLGTTNPTISSVANPSSPGITGYPSNAGTNMGGQKLAITGTHFSGTSITVSFTPTVNSSTAITAAGSLQPDGNTIIVDSPTTSPFGAVEIYIVNVCIDGTCTTYNSGNATKSQQFNSLASLVVSSGTWSADINVAAGGTVTILNKAPSRSYPLSFWERGPSGGWVPSPRIGGQPTDPLPSGASLALIATNAGTTNVTVAVTTNSEPPETISSGVGPAVGSNGTINVGTSGG